MAFESEESREIRKHNEHVFQRISKERSEWIRKFDEYIVGMICHETNFDAAAVVRLASTLADKRAEMVSERFKEIDQILGAVESDDE